MHPLHPTPESFHAFASSPEQGPVVMLNLLKFKPGGERLYNRYGKNFARLAEPKGVKILYIGNAAEMMVGAETWDRVALVEYPSRQVFVDIIQSGDYAAIADDRLNALERTVLYATNPLVPGAARSATDASPGA